MISITNSASGFSPKIVSNLALVLKDIYQQETPPADKIEVLMDDMLWADKTKTVYASVKLTVGKKVSISKVKFRLSSTNTIDRRTFSYL